MSESFGFFYPPTPFSTAQEWSKFLNGLYNNLNIESNGSSNVLIQGSVSPGAPLVQLFSGTISGTVQTINITGYVFVQVTVQSGDPVSGNVS